MSRILVPLPDEDFDITEVAVPWHVLTEAGHEVVFATQAGGVAPRCDPLLKTGVVFGQLGAEPEPLRLYGELERDPAFGAPVSWRTLSPEDYDGLLLPGGHAQGMRQYLEGAELLPHIATFFARDAPVAAICHGVLAAARATDERGRSVLAGRRTTCLPRYMEQLAWMSTAWKVGRYFRTYDTWVEVEVRAALEDPATQFERGPIHLFRRGSRDDDGPAFVVRDGNYVSGRWPGDAWLLARTLDALLSGRPSSA